MDKEVQFIYHIFLLYLAHKLPMSYFNPQFEEKLTEAVQSIESVSKVEVVVVVKEKSSNYQHIPLLVSVIAFFIGFAYFMLTPIVYGDAMIVSGSLGVLIVAYGLGSLNPIKKLFLKKDSLNQKVELNARAIFQKAGIHHTQDEIGLLIYASKLEGRVMLVPDRGIESEIHPDEIKVLQNELELKFTQGSPDDFIHALKGFGELFADRLPVTENDVNELPDYLDINI